MKDDREKFIEKRKFGIPLDTFVSPLGIRLFIKPENPFRGILRITVRCSKQKKEIALAVDTKAVINQGWQIQQINDLFKKARDVALLKGWDTSEMFIDRVILDTRGVSNYFYVDEIELYLLNLK